MRDSFNFNKTISRRGFLRGSSLAVLSSVVAPRLGFGGQEPTPQDPSAKGSETKDKQEEDGRPAPSTEQQATAQDRKPDEQQESQVTKTDANGREYRVCPECGSNMYRQDRVWTCENCGYSYTE